MLKYGERFTEIVIKDTAGNVVVHPERVEDDSLGTSAIGLYFPRLQHATPYILEVPEGAFINPETEAFSRAFSLSFTTATHTSFVWTSPGKVQRKSFGMNLLWWPSQNPFDLTWFEMRPFSRR